MNTYDIYVYVLADSAYRLVLFGLQPTNLGRTSVPEDSTRWQLS